MHARWICGLTASLALSACASPPPPAQTSAAQIGRYGLDLSSRDATIKPGDDFYRFADGHWLATTPIPADRTTWGSFSELESRAEQGIRAIAEGLQPGAPEGSTEQKVGDFYRAYLDTTTIEKTGLEPARAGLAAISGARRHEDIAKLMGRRDLGFRGPLRLVITTDQKNPDRYIVTVTQSGLSLPDRDYYLNDTPVYKDLRAKYAAHVGRLLGLAGEQNSAA